MKDENSVSRPGADAWAAIRPDLYIISGHKMQFFLSCDVWNLVIASFDKQLLWPLRNPCHFSAANHLMNSAPRTEDDRAHRVVDIPRFFERQ